MEFEVKQQAQDYKEYALYKASGNVFLYTKSPLLAGVLMLLVAVFLFWSFMIIPLPESDWLLRLRTIFILFGFTSALICTYLLYRVLRALKSYPRSYAKGARQYVIAADETGLLKKDRGMESLFHWSQIEDIVLLKNLYVVKPYKQPAFFFSKKDLAEKEQEFAALLKTHFIPA